jgi:hypothetical protein
MIIRVAHKVMPRVFSANNKDRNKNLAEMLFYHENARPHTSLKTHSLHGTTVLVELWPPHIFLFILCGMFLISIF